MIKVVCFDLFSTLVDVASVPLSIGRMTADIFGMDRAHWNALCFSSKHEICKPTIATDVIRRLVHSYDSSISDELIQQAVYERQCRFDYALTEHIQDDVLDGIRALKEQGYTIVLVSNASTAEVLAWPDSPLCRYFDHSVFSCSIGLKKPDIGIYQHVCDLVSVDSEECVFVGDGGSNELVGAKEAGMKVLMMTRFLKNNKVERFKNYAHCIDGDIASTVEVLEWINALNNRKLST